MFKKGLSNPFNYTGSKHRYLDDLFEILPVNEHLNILDPFVGGGDLCCHLPARWTINAFDKEPGVIRLHEMFNVNNVRHARFHISKIEDTIKKWGLGRNKKESYVRFRTMFNSKAIESRYYLYILIFHSHSSRIRFNLDGGFNVPSGLNTFNRALKEKAINYADRLSKRDVSFKCGSYKDVDFSKYDLCLIDPPYLNTSASYNIKWDAKDQLNLNSKIEQECKKFVYFGQTWSKGIHNKELDEFSKKYNFKNLRDTTLNCSGNRKKNGKTTEIMIWNF